MRQPYLYLFYLRVSRLWRCNSSALNWNSEQSVSLGKYDLHDWLEQKKVCTRTFKAANRIVKHVTEAFCRKLVHHQFKKKVHSAKVNCCETVTSSLFDSGEQSLYLNKSMLSLGICAGKSFRKHFQDIVFGK